MIKWNLEVQGSVKDSKEMRSFMLFVLVVLYVLADDANIMDEILNSNILMFMPIFLFRM